MKKTLLIFPILIFGTFFLLAQPNQADTLQNKSEEDKEGKLTVLNTRKSSLSIVNDFHTTTSGFVLDPKAPRFLLYDTKHNVAFGIGGFARLRIGYDFKGSPTNSFGFVPNSIPVPENIDSRTQFMMDPSKSTLFFKLIGHNKTIGRYEGYISGSFTGNNFGFVLNDAYVKLMGFTIGRTWSTFNDMGAVPNTVDFQGPNGAAEMRTPLIRYQYKFGKGWKVALSVELPQSSATYYTVPEGAITQAATSATQRIPDIPAYIQYSWAQGNSHVRLAGVFRGLSYKSDDKIRNTYGYGIQFSGNIDLGKYVELFFQGNYGNGIAQYLNDLSGMGWDLVYDNQNPLLMKAQTAYGYFAALQFNFTSNIFATIGYSEAGLLNKGNIPLNISASSNENMAYLSGRYIVGNIFWNITPDIQLGAEYIYGSRTNFDKSSGTANCIQAVIQYNF